MERIKKESAIESHQPSTRSLDDVEKVEAKEGRQIGFVLHETASSAPVLRPPARAPRNRILNAVEQAGTPPRRRRLGEGICVKLTGEKRKRKLPKHELSYEAHRPYFTYWMTFVQTVICVASIVLYGIGPFGVGRMMHAAEVRTRTLTTQKVTFFEQQNMWFGPSYKDLVALGAKFTPCMRRDKLLFDGIKQQREIEEDSACCIYNDGSMCYQSAREDCPNLLATWHKYNTRNPSRGGLISGSVCGQHPSACLNPKPDTLTWPPEITSWPICREIDNSSAHNYPEMQCELSGRPCCIGYCAITTSDYCNFVKGIFHPEATLCSQVSCLEETCGMLPFVQRDQPDQVSRLLFSLFIHAGVLQLAITVIYQLVFMVDMEHTIGWCRMALIYLLSGVGGNIASAIFSPFQPQTGPAGAQFGLLAALFVDAVYSWRVVGSAFKAVLQLAFVTIVLLLAGMLPWVDNWAHIFGFLIGLPLSLILLPYLKLHWRHWLNRVAVIVFSVLIVVGLFATLIVFFFFIQITDCPFCQWVNCLPVPTFGEHFCDNQGLVLASTNGAF